MDNGLAPEEKLGYSVAYTPGYPEVVERVIKSAEEMIFRRMAESKMVATSGFTVVHTANAWDPDRMIVKVSVMAQKF